MQLFCMGLYLALIALLYIYIIMIARLLRRNIYSVRMGKKFGEIVDESSEKSAAPTNTPNTTTETIKISPNITATTTVKTGNTSYSNLPFKLAGLKQTPTHNASIQTMVQFERPLIKEIYKNFLSAVQKKDKAALSKILDPQLVNPFLNSQKLSYLNKEANIQIYFKKLQTGLGDIKRIPYSTKTFVHNQPNFTYYIVMDMNDTSKVLQYRNTGVPILHSLHLYVKSKATLGQSDDKGTEQRLHLIVLEQQQKKSLQDFASAMSNMQSLQIRPFLFQSSTSWRIGNIDYYLPERIDDK